MMNPIEYQIMAGAPRATVEDALRMFAALVAVFEQHGFMLALYGSTVQGRGIGADVDMFAVPGRPVSLSDAQLCVSRVCCTMGFSQQGQPYAGLMGTYAVVLREEATGKILDLQFREVAPPSWQHFNVIRIKRSYGESDHPGSELSFFLEVARGRGILSRVSTAQVTALK